VGHSNRKIASRAGLAARREAWRQAGKKVVWTNGCFDLLHVGHVRSLEAARSLGDILIVGVNGDESVRRLKGPLRPILPSDERAELLAALGCVDFVTIFDETTPVECLLALKPDLCCKGAEYRPPHGRPIPEAETVASYGGTVSFLPLTESTSTSIIISLILEKYK
jgi:D-beta-D-heptose 7-phosphate kinase/D-beta-D-heptose 1-phosphate adenosyltransferase